MRSLKTQYFLTYSVLGCFLPFLPVYLAARGLTLAQIGQVMAAGSLAVLVTPALVGFLADTHVDPRRLLALLALLAGAAAAALYCVRGFWPILTIYALHNLAFIPFVSLQDGMNFCLQRDLVRRGQTIEPYHRVRVWGTVGFILPSIVLYFLLHAGLPLGVVLFTAAGGCALGMVNTFLLPEGCRPPRADMMSGTPGGACPDAQSALFGREDTADGAIGIAPLAVPCDAEQPPEAPESPEPPEPPEPPESPQPPEILESPSAPGHLPALTALRVMLEPHVLVYCLGMFLANMAMYAYYTYYPIYLTDQAHIGQQWVGVIANLGVVFEIVYMMSFGWLERTLGFKRLLAIGMSGIVLRMLLVGLSGTWVVAIGTQILHGLMVLVIHVMPPVYLDRRAHDHNRNSVQALYAMLVNGSGRIAGSLAAGMIAANLSMVFLAAAATAALGGGLLAFAFQERTPAVAAVVTKDLGQIR